MVYAACQKSVGGRSAVGRPKSDGLKVQAVRQLDCVNWLASKVPMLPDQNSVPLDGFRAKAKLLSE